MLKWIQVYQVLKTFSGKLVKGAVTGESAVKPLYTGTGCVMLEPDL